MCSNRCWLLSAKGLAIDLQEKLPRFRAQKILVVCTELPTTCLECTQTRDLIKQMLMKLLMQFFKLFWKSKKKSLITGTDTKLPQHLIHNRLQQSPSRYAIYFTAQTLNLVLLRTVLKDLAIYLCGPILTVAV